MRGIYLISFPDDLLMFPDLLWATLGVFYNINCSQWAGWNSFGLFIALADKRPLLRWYLTLRHIWAPVFDFFNIHTFYHLCQVLPWYTLTRVFKKRLVQSWNIYLNFIVQPVIMARYQDLYQNIEFLAFFTYFSELQYLLLKTVKNHLR